MAYLTVSARGDDAATEENIGAMENAFEKAGMAKRQMNLVGDLIVGLCFLR